jgi:AhpD family alkylhydroperoxidase
MSLHAYQSRFSWAQLEHAVPEVVKGLVELGAKIDQSGLDRKLIELVKVRASQINGCAYCVQFHVNKARHLGVEQAKLDTLVTWRDVSVFSDAERAALAWTEALTDMANQHVGDEVYALLKAHYSETELANLTSAIGLINAWNRIAGGLQIPPPPSR